MGKSLVIVESPAKAKTLGKYLGSAYDVRASVGHVIDLPEKRLGVDIENNFEPTYEIIPGKGKILKELRQAAKSAEAVYLAPDPDREGEAIAWHIANTIKQDDGKVHRVMFNEITKKAVLEAMQNPTRLNKNLFDAQQARRVLDRLVGYQISPILWKTVMRGLSAGRVQSVAVRMVCEREEEIRAYLKKEYWSIVASMATLEAKKFDSRVFSFDELRILTRPDTEADRKDRCWIKDEKQAAEIVRDIQSAERYVVTAVERKQKKRSAPPPFITSTMQREAAVRFGWSSRKTMRVAQSLYEGVDIGLEGTVGLITYMRTDSTRLSEEALTEARRLIAETYGEKYLPKGPIRYTKKKGNVQDAHEAVRATSVYHLPEQMKKYLDKDQQKLYGMIWTRHVACQMNAAVYDQNAVDISAGSRAVLRATGSVMRFPGFTKVYSEVLDRGSDSSNGNGDDDADHELPDLKEGDEVKLEEIKPNQHFSQPPPRFTESSLIRELEANGIGRPSTYASIMGTIIEKGYVDRLKNQLKPTDLGFTVNQLLVDRFPGILNVKFTARMEDLLDKVEEGDQNWKAVLKDFYSDFKPALDEALKSKKKVLVETNIKCDKCGSTMVIRYSRHGAFLGCSGFPECSNTKQFTRDENGEIQILKEEVVEGETCKCGRPMIRKNGPYGPYLACSGYPECREVRPISTGIPCPRDGCGGEIVQKSTRKGKTFWGCNNYPTCDYASWDRPIKASCKVCEATPIFEKSQRRKGAATYVFCEKCKTRFSDTEVAEMETAGINNGQGCT